MLGLRVAKNGAVIRLWVIPNASETGPVEYDDWRQSFKFKTKEPAKDGQANRSILGFFSSRLGKEAVLISGAKSKEKEILVLGATLEELSKAVS